MRILFVCHNTPYPPNKGDKIRPYYIIKKLSESHEVHLLSLCKDSRDIEHQTTLESFCNTVTLVPLHSLWTKVLALACILSPWPLTFGYFFSFRVKRELRRLTREKDFDVVFAFCSSSAQYVLDCENSYRVVDFVDIDSDKWNKYATVSAWPMSFIYSLEHKRLERWEGIIAQKVQHCILTTEREKACLEDISGKDASRITVVTNGIDYDFFSRADQSKNISVEPNLVFTGQMDYLPNIDAVIYFYLNILPIVKKEVPNVKFYIVGRNPDPQLQEQCSEAIVTGEVDDIRAYLDKARVFVAPLRLAFGIQNKVLEAMARGVPVVTTSNVAKGLKAIAGRDLSVADDPQDFALKVIELLKDEKVSSSMSLNAKQYVEKHHDWSKIVGDFESILETSVNEAV